MVKSATKQGNSDIIDYKNKLSGTFLGFSTFCRSLTIHRKLIEAKVFLKNYASYTFA